MKLLDKFLKKNTFIFRGGKIEAISLKASKKDNCEINKSLLPIVIIAREHYQEQTKLYPVPDKSEVKSIIENEYAALKLYSIQAQDLTSFTAKLFLFDDEAEAFIQSNSCLFIPETLLSKFLKEGELTTVNRLGASLNLIFKGNTVYSSSGRGLYEDPALFLFSSGAGDADSQLELDQDEYFERLESQLVELRQTDLTLLLSGQIVHKKLWYKMHLPSVLAGFTLSMLVYWGVLFGHLHWLNNYKQEQISNEEVKGVIALQRQLNEKVATVGALSRQIDKSITGNVVWEIVAEMLEKEVSISNLIYENNELKLGMLAPSATDTIKFIRGLTNVAKVTVDGDIFEMNGKQNVQVVIELKKEGIND